MTAPLDWTDESTFLADARRRRSDEVELGASWRSGTSDTWRLSWVRDTGELYLVRNDSLVGAASRLVVLAVIAAENTLDGLLAGWQQACDGEEGLAWLSTRLDMDRAA